MAPLRPAAKARAVRTQHTTSACGGSSRRSVSLAVAAIAVLAVACSLPTATRAARFPDFAMGYAARPAGHHEMQRAHHQGGRAASVAAPDAASTAPGATFSPSAAHTPSSGAHHGAAASTAAAPADLSLLLMHLAQLQAGRGAAMTARAAADADATAAATAQMYGGGRTSDDVAAWLAARALEGAAAAAAATRPAELLAVGQALQSAWLGQPQQAAQPAQQQWVQAPSAAHAVLPEDWAPSDSAVPDLDASATYLDDAATVGVDLARAAQEEEVVSAMLDEYDMLYAYTGAAGAQDRAPYPAADAALYGDGGYSDAAPADPSGIGAHGLSAAAAAQEYYTDPDLNIEPGASSALVLGAPWAQLAAAVAEEVSALRAAAAAATEMAEAVAIKAVGAVADAAAALVPGGEGGGGRPARSLLGKDEDKEGEDDDKKGPKPDRGPKSRPESDKPKRSPPEPKPVNVWIPGIVSVRKDEDGDTTVRVGPAGMITTVRSEGRGPQPERPAALGDLPGADGPLTNAAEAAATATATATASGLASAAASAVAGGGGGAFRGGLSGPAAEPVPQGGLFGSEAFPEFGGGGVAAGGVLGDGVRGGGGSGLVSAITPEGAALAQSALPGPLPGGVVGPAGGAARGEAEPKRVVVSVGPGGSLVRAASNGGRTAVDVMGGTVARVRTAP